MGGEGLNSVELYNPSSGTRCSLPKLTHTIYYHTLENNIHCGGQGPFGDRCLQWSPDTGSWEELLLLDVERWAHVVWTPGTGIGTYLMGGWQSGSSKTTALIKSDGTQEEGFPLQHNAM